MPYKDSRDKRTQDAIYRELNRDELAAKQAAYQRTAKGQMTAIRHEATRRGT